MVRPRPRQSLSCQRCCDVVQFCKNVFFKWRLKVSTNKESRIAANAAWYCVGSRMTVCVSVLFVL